MANAMTSPYPLVIFIVEDNDALRQALCEMLSRDGHLCVGLSCAEDVDDAVLQETPDLYLIDLNLPEEDGLSLTRRVRQSQPDVGIVILTARTEITDRLSGYEEGVDLYLSKPIHPNELSAIVASLAKRLQTQKTAQGTSISVQTENMLLCGPKGQAQLTISEVKLLEAIARAPGQMLQSWQVAAQLGQSETLPSKASVEVRLSRIRKKMVDIGTQANALKAIKGYGYKLNVTVTVSRS